MAKSFVRGILILLPIVATAYVVWLIGATFSPIFAWIGRLFGGELPAALRIGLGLAVSIVGIVATGMFATNWLGRQMLVAIERLFRRVPLLKLLHNSIRDLLGAFVGERKSFDRPVLVSLGEGDGAKIAGFVTRDDLSFLGAAGHVAVYLPQSFNFAGNLLLVPRDRVKPLSAPSRDVMTFLVSGGVSIESP